MGFSREQRRVLGGMASGMAVALGGLFGALVAGGTGLLTGPGAYSRLDFWAGWTIPVAWASGRSAWRLGSRAR